MTEFVPHRPPQRIQMRRTRGWRMPEGAVSVARPTRWGNNWKVGDRVEIRVSGTVQGPCAGLYRAHDDYGYDHVLDTVTTLDAALAVELYEDDLRSTLEDDDPASREIAEALAALGGHDLGCYCTLDQPCHGDVLLRLANP